MNGDYEIFIVIFSNQEYNIPVRWLIKYVLYTRHGLYC